MKTAITAAMLLLALAACRTVRQEEPPEVTQDVAATPAYSFRDVDSHMLAGEFEPARTGLLSMLGDTLVPEKEVLTRLFGLYSGRAMEDELIEALDSLESCGMGPFNGWKVSALMLTGRPMEALPYAAVMGDTLLSSWLLSGDSIPAYGSLPEADGSSGPRAAAMIMTLPGGLGADIPDLRVPAVGPLPWVVDRYLVELQVTADTAGAWWWTALDSLRAAGAVSGAELLEAERLTVTGGGDLEYWTGLADRGGTLTVTAVRELQEGFPGALVPSWKVVDELANAGETDLALQLSLAGDAFHRLGSQMAVQHSQAMFRSLMTLCESVDAGMPDSLRARAALFRARALRGESAGGEAVHTAFLAFAYAFPWHPEARMAAYDAGKYFDCEQEWARAADAYMTSLRSSGSYAGDERAHWRCGFSYYMSGLGSMADSLWTAGATLWPAGYWRDEMLFWRARAAGDRGDPELRDSLLASVAAEHPWEFYGMLASRRTGVTLQNRFIVPEVDLSGSPTCSMAMQLLSEGYGDLAVELLVNGTGPVADRAVMLSLMGRNGSALHMLRDLDSDLRDSHGLLLPDSLLAVYFPAPYLDLARSATDTLRLDASLLQGIMREESYFDRWVVSSAGARGVVQLMPGTAQDVARWYDLPVLGEEEFFDPAASVPYGAIYIDRQRSAYDGQEALFLAAYNAGPGNSSRWVEMHGWNSLDPELYIEQITFRETRMYVKKVLRSGWIYEGFGGQ